MALWAVMLYIGGVILILAEFIVPGGVCGLIGFMMVAASVYLGCTAAPALMLFIIIGELVGLIIAIIGGFYWLPKTRLGRTLILVDSQDPSAGWVAVESDHSLVGQEGTVLTALRPAGTVQVGGKRISAVSDGTFIEDNARVRVTEVHGNRVVVERVQVEPEA